MDLNALIDADKQLPVKPKKEREQIALIESQPSENWFLQATDARGRLIWFLRLQITGLRTRRYGPFPTKHRAVLFLDTVLSKIDEGLMDAVNYLGPYQVRDPQFASRTGHYPIVEDELIGATAQEGR